jgi:hypothetical protein
MGEVILTESQKFCIDSFMPVIDKLQMHLEDRFAAHKLTIVESVFY